MRTVIPRSAAMALSPREFSGGAGDLLLLGMPILWELGVSELSKENLLVALIREKQIPRSAVKLGKSQAMSLRSEG